MVSTPASSYKNRLTTDVSCVDAFLPPHASRDFASPETFGWFFFLNRRWKFRGVTFPKVHSLNWWFFHVHVFRYHASVDYGSTCVTRKVVKVLLNIYLSFRCWLQAITTDLIFYVLLLATLPTIIYTDLHVILFLLVYSVTRVIPFGGNYISNFLNNPLNLLVTSIPCME